MALSPVIQNICTIFKQTYFVLVVWVDNVADQLLQHLSESVVAVLEAVVIVVAGVGVGVYQLAEYLDAVLSCERYLGTVRLQVKTVYSK